MNRFALVIYNEDHSEPCQYAKIIKADTKSGACDEMAKILLDRHFEFAPPFDYEIMEIREKESDQDAVDIIQAFARMCVKEMGCAGCGLSYENNGTGKVCEIFMKENPEKAVKIIRQYANEHPVETRQSKLLKMYPNVYIDKQIGTVNILPCTIDRCVKPDDCASIECADCCRKYWLEEIEDEE